MPENPYEAPQQTSDRVRPPPDYAGTTSALRWMMRGGVAGFGLSSITGLVAFLALYLQTRSVVALIVFAAVVPMVAIVSLSGGIAGWIAWRFLYFAGQRDE